MPSNELCKPAAVAQPNMLLAHEPHPCRCLSPAIRSPACSAPLTCCCCCSLLVGSLRSTAAGLISTVLTASCFAIGTGSSNHLLFLLSFLPSTFHSPSLLLPSKATPASLRAGQGKPTPLTLTLPDIPRDTVAMERSAAVTKERLVKRVRVEGVRRRARGREWYEWEEEGRVHVKGASPEVEAMGCRRTGKAISFAEGAGRERVGWLEERERAG